MDHQKILIVDDNPTDLFLLKSQLEEYHILEANSGRTALKMLTVEKPDLVLMNLLMSGMDGYAVLSILKNCEETQFIPIITMASTADVKIKSLEKGADAFLSKPLNPLELKARVKSLLKIKDVQDELQSMYDLIISLTLSRESNDPFWVNHSKRTAFYAEKLAQRIVPLKSVHQLIRSAALLHDIGKIQVPKDILRKPGQLTPEELEVVRRHPVISEEICSPISRLQPLLPYIRHHHERYDGSGYPDRLKGAEIPLGARILAVADGFDSLTNKRPYRKAFSRLEALQMMHDLAGIQWDPELVNQFCIMLSDPTFNLQQIDLL